MSFTLAQLGLYLKENPRDFPQPMSIVERAVEMMDNSGFMFSHCANELLGQHGEAFLGLAGSNLRYLTVQLEDVFVIDEPTGESP